MKVVFVNPAQEMGGIQCLSAFLVEHDIETALVNDPRLLDNPWIQFPKLQRFLDNKEKLAQEILAHEPDLIGFSVVADDYRWAVDWAKYLKNICNTPIVFGNIYPTTNPIEVLNNKEVDFVVRGEGEFTLLELVRALEGKIEFKDILGLGYKESGGPKVNPLRPLIEDMDILPYPDKDLTYKTMPYLDFGYTTMTGRGCPYRCSFCDNNTSRDIYKSSGTKQKWTRRHSPEYVVEEIRWAKERYGIKHIRFNDEDFSYDRKWVLKFCELYEASGLRVPWFAWVYPNTIDLEVAQAMARAGCDSVEMGVQSGSHRLRRDIIHRVTPNNKIIAAMQAFREVGIRCTVDIIVGLPTETEEDLYETVHVLTEGRPWHIYAFWLRYYSHTEISKIAMNLNILKSEDLVKIEQGAHSRGHLAGGTEREKSSLARKFHTLIILLPILPQWTKKFVHKKRLVRFVPHLNPFLLVNFTKSLKPNPFDEFRYRTINMYLFELKKMLGAALSRLGPRATQGQEFLSSEKKSQS